MTGLVADDVVEFAKLMRRRTRMPRIARLSMPFLAAATATALGAGIAVASDALVAIIEDVQAPSTELRVMDYLSDGTEIRLRPGETLTISYFRSCLTETIGAGEVRIGHDKSTVSENAKIERRVVECGVQGVYLTARQAEQSAGVVLRVPPSGEDTEPAALTVYSTAPLFVFPARAKKLVIERIDGAGRETHRIRASAGRIDLLATKVRLTPGATYSAGTKFGATTFKVSPVAKETEPLLLRRLIPF